jgi:peroxiredoxin
MKGREIAWAAVLLVVVCGSILYVRAPRVTWVTVGGGIPDATLPILGKERSQALHDLRGLPLLLVFFETDSKTSADQLPQIETIHKYFLPRTLRVVGVAVDMNTAKADSILRDLRVTFEVLSDPGGKVGREAFHIESFPEAYLVRQSGRVEAVFPGPIRWRTEEMDNLITRVLPKNAPHRIK